MRTEFVTKGFSKTEAMEEFLQQSTLDSVDTMLKREKDVHLRVVVDEDSRRTQTRKPHFVCEITLKSGASKKMIKVKKTATDFRQAVLEASRTLKMLLRKRSEKRHHEKQVNQRPYMESPWAVINPRWDTAA